MWRLASFFKIRPGEGRTVALLIGVMASMAAGAGMGAASIDALFFARFGVEFLPYLYILLGMVTFFSLMAVTGLFASIPRQRLYAVLPVVLGAVILVFRLLVGLDLRGFYPVVFIGKDVLLILQSIVVWGLAGSLFDTRQAKRLFPLFMAGNIAGVATGSLLTPLLVGWLRAENILVVWALFLGLASLLVRRLNATPMAETPSSSSMGRVKASFLGEIQRGYQSVRHSEMLRWFSLASILFSILWYSLLLPFSRAVAAQYPDADAMAGFLGLFMGLQNGTALLVSLLIANRLFDRLGLVNSILTYPLIYLVGFSTLLAVTAFPVIVVFRFIQMIWGQSIAETAYQASLNAIPARPREQARAFMSAVPGQAGVIISGVLLVIGERALPPQQLYWIGLGAALLCLLVMWRARGAHRNALVEALRAGHPHIFSSEEEPFGGFLRDGAALPVILGGLEDAHPGVRLLSAELLEQFKAPQAIPALVQVLDDPDAEVRLAALRALTATDASAAASHAMKALGDADPDLRCQAIETLSRQAPDTPGILDTLQALIDDPLPAVRGRAAVAIARLGDPEASRTLISRMLQEPEPEMRIQALRAAGESWELVPAGRPWLLDAVVAGLQDLQPAVRRAAAESLAQPPAELLQLLLEMLGDQDQAVRQAAAEALGRVGTSTQTAILDLLSDPQRAPGALLALGQFVELPEPQRLRRYASQEVSQATHYHHLKASLGASGDDRQSLLGESLLVKARQHALNALSAIALIKERRSVLLSIENLNSPDPSLRAYALEALESIGEPQLVRPLIPLWEPAAAQAAQAAQVASLNGAWQEVLDDQDAWLRACGVLLALSSDNGELSGRAGQLASTDPDALVRETASQALQGESPMETLQTLSTMERVLFLRRVNLFARLAPVDLKQIATVAQERLFSDEEVIVRKGEPGDEMYVIVSGEVRVLGEQGSELARRKAGDIVGEMAIISQGPRMATLVAAGDVRALCLDQKQFEDILRERFEISLAVMRELSFRLRESAEARNL